MQQAADCLFNVLLNEVVNGVTEEKLSETQQTYNCVVNQTNAYTSSSDGIPNRWNMITYKNGQRSQL